MNRLIRTSGGPAPAPAPHRRRPTFDVLEERSVPAAPTFTPLTNLAPASSGGIGTMMLLTDGTVMAQGGGVANTWYKLTPDASGSYVSGTWSSLASMSTQRLYFGSNVLPSGKVFVLGGEYSGPVGAQNLTNTGEVYDPVADSWSPTVNFPQANFGDDPTEVLANGKILCGYVFDGRTYLYDPAANTFTATGTKLRGDQSDEEAWVKLPDGSILSYDIFSTVNLNAFHAQRYLPSSGTWVDASTHDGSIGAGFNLGDNKVGFELGPALLLSDGRVFQVGANGNTAFYNIATGVWSAGPQIFGANGKLYGADDAPGVVLPDGQVLFLADEGPTLGTFSAPTGVFDFDPTTNKITEITPAALSGGLSAAPAFTERLLMLPSGQVLYADGSQQLYAITPAGSPQAAAVPTIGAITPNGANKFTLTGTQLNGINEGAAYGDDVEMASNYPIVRLQNGAGNVSFARTTNWTSQVVTGAALVSTDFAAAATAGPYLLSVSANGIASSDVLFVQLGPGANNVTLRLDSTGTQVQVVQGLSTALGQFALTGFTAIDIAGSGSVTLDFSKGAFGKPITFNAGAGFNGLTIASTAPLASVTYDATGASAGDFVVNGDAADPITFAGLAGPVLSATAGTLTLNIDPANAVSGLVTTTFTAAGARTLASPDNSLASLAFANPSAALVVNGHAGDDHLVFQGVASSFAAALSIPASGGTNTVDFGTPLHLGSAKSSGNVSVTATTINLGNTLDTTAGPTPGTLSLNGNVSLTAAATLKYGGAGGLTVNGGTLSLGTSPLFVTDLASGDTGTITDPIAGSGGLTKAGPGTLILPGASSGFTGTATVAAGALQVDGTIAAQVALTGGTLTGTGTTGAVSGTAGAVAAGDAGPAPLTVAGLSLPAGTSLNFGIAGTGANQAGTVIVNAGTIVLGGTLNLAVFGGFSPAAGETFTIISNGTGGAVSGQLLAGAGIDGFAAGTPLPEGALLTSNFLGVPLSASLTYQGGASGHDVDILLTVQITDGPPPSATTVGANYSFQYTATGNPTPTFSYTGTLPPGVNLDPTSGLLNGVPTTPGTFTGTVFASNSQGSAAQAFSITVNPVITLSPTSLPDDTINIAYNQVITAAKGTGTKSLAVSNVQNAIAGLNLTPGTNTLTISGTPTASGTMTFDVTATDQAGATTVGHYSINVNPAIVLNPATATLPADTVGVAYNQVIAASLGTGVKTLSVTVQSAVPGLNVPAGGSGSIAITGTPTAAGTEKFTVTATDQVGATATLAYSITVNPAITLSPPALGPADVGNPYSQTITAAGGTGGVTLAVSKIQNPIVGLIVPLSGNGALAISGTPTVAGTETFTVTATDLVGGTATVNYSITVNPALAFSPPNLPGGTVNIAYDQIITATGGTGGANALTVTNVVGAIPGLSVPASGTNTIEITGTPKSVGTETFFVTARDALGVAISSSFSITVNPAVTLPAPALPNDTVGVAYNQLIVASGGTGNKTLVFSNVQNAIPGLVVPASATNGLSITGTPTAPGTETFTVTATDAVGAQAQAVYTVTVNPAPSFGPTNLAQDTVGITYGQTITATGGTGSLTLTVSNVQNAIAGLILPPTGTGVLTLGGQPSATGTETFTVTATDSLGGATSANYAIVVNPPVTLGPPSLPPADVGFAYSQLITASGGTGASTLTVSAPQNPIPNLSVAVTGPGVVTVSGTPSATGTETFTVTATDAVGAVTRASYSLTVGPALTLSPASLLPGVVGDPDNQTITAAGGTGTLTLTAGPVSNPIPGLSLGTAGAGTLTIGGTPTAAGTESFSVTATDQANGSVTQTYSVTVAPPLSLSPVAGALPPDTVNIVTYHQTITGGGGFGTPTLTVSNVQNALAGLHLPLSAAGSVSITGLPTQVGTETFTVTAMSVNALGITDRASATYSITVNPPLRILVPTLPLYGAVGQAYNQAVRAIGGTGAYTFAVAPTGPLPPGLGIDPSSGIISGTPTAAGTFSYTINVTDALGGVASLAFTLTVLPAGDSYNAVTHALVLTGTNFGYTQATTADAGGTHTTFTFAMNNGTWSFPDAALSTVGVVGNGPSNVAVVATGDTYVGVNGQAAETAEVLTLGEGGGSVARGGAAAFLTFSNFSTVYASAGQTDVAFIVGTPGVLNTLVGIGAQAYMSSGSAFYYVNGARYVYGYAAGPYDAVYNYDGPGPSVYVVSGTASSFMLGSDGARSFFNEGVGFNTNVAITQHGGDLAYVYDSPGDDTFVAYALYAQMTAAAGPGGGPGEMDILAAGATGAYFAHVYAYSFVGGNDLASVDPTAAAEYTVGYYNPTTRLGFHKA